METSFTKVIPNKNDCAQYMGTVTVSAYLGDRLIKQETHHNAGLQNLFKFVGSCLQGNWAEAKSRKPSKLLLLRAATGENLKNGDPDRSNPIDNASHWGEAYAACSPTAYTNAALSKITSVEGKPASAVTYHFSIPFLKLLSGAKVQKLLLLPSSVSDYAREACAYYILDEEIEIPEASGNFTLVIDWTLTFTNA